MKDELIDCDYIATTHTILRGCWLFSFSAEIFRSYVDTDVTLKDIATSAYNNHLGIYHNWLLKNLVNWAIGLVNTREEFEASLETEQVKVQ